MRDAILLHQAIAESEPGRDRAELLISRLVRLHWAPHHLERVKAEYRSRYGRDVERAIREEILAPNSNSNANANAAGAGAGAGASNGAGASGNAVAAAGGAGRNTDWVEFCVELVRSSAFHAGSDDDDDGDGDGDGNGDGVGVGYGYGNGVGYGIDVDGIAS